jgi:hypothetical protein
MFCDVKEEHRYVATRVSLQRVIRSLLVAGESCSLLIKVTVWRPLKEVPLMVAFEAFKSQSQSRFATDGPSVSLFQCRAPCGAHDQILVLV